MNPQASALCTVFQLIADRTWQRLQRSAETSIRIREDAFTSFNLQDLHPYKSSTFTFFDFTPIEECQVSRADWEWWFLQPNAAFGAAIQAKSLKDRMYDIGYKPKKGRLQIETLIQYSRSHGVYPQYCFYNFWHGEPALSRIWPCFSLRAELPLWGCAIADGAAIWDLHRSKMYGIDSILPLCFPWHCLVCCPGIFTPDQSGEGPATRAHGFAGQLRQRGREHFREGATIPLRPSRRIRPPILTRQPPERIRLLMEMDRQQIHPSRDEILRLWDSRPPAFVLIIGNEQQFEVQ